MPFRKNCGQSQELVSDIRKATHTRYLSAGWDAERNCLQGGRWCNPRSTLGAFDAPSRILSEDVHRIIDLDVHVVTNIRQLFTLGRDRLAILGHDLVRRVAMDAEFPLNNDTVAVFPRLVSILALILDSNCNLGISVINICQGPQCYARANRDSLFTLTDKRFQTRSATGYRGFTTKSDGQCRENGALSALSIPMSMRGTLYECDITYCHCGL